ncbi:MAG TPA: hypothetical protein DCG69_06895 [Bacteroidales bacterium]|nr:hypothetical protein [Bacteroidales bacterium]
MTNVIKFLKFVISSLFVLILFSCSCGVKEVELPKPPTNIVLTISVHGEDSENPYGDGSGKIDITVTVNDATIYKFEMGNGIEQESSIGYLSYTYLHTGTQTYTVKVTASNVDGSISTSKQITVLCDPYAGIKKSLSNSTSKSWYWNQSITGHLGQGLVSSTQPTLFSAAPNEFESIGCFYDDKITFTKENNGEITFVIDNNGSTFFNKNEVFDALGLENSNQDACYDFSAPSSKTVVFSDATSGILNSTKINFTIQDNGFMSYYLGNSTYEVLSISETEMQVRVIQDVNGLQTVWYHKFTTTPTTHTGNFDQLIWSDEFNNDGAPSTSNWNYDIGAGGWGNGELQYYTSRSENVIQQSGNLVITAKKELYNGSSYTSARLKTQGKFSFTYGKVEVCAKLPSGIGVWPAIWMLGDNITSLGWPACGEVDIMEYWGYIPNVVSSALHTPSSYGNTINHHSYNLPTAEEEFHVYGMEWTTTQIRFYVDGILHYTYAPSVLNNDTWPYINNQFIILNLAIGGNTDGGQGVDDNIFPQQFLIDYVRVYQ